VVSFVGVGDDTCVWGVGVVRVDEMVPPPIFRSVWRMLRNLYEYFVLEEFRRRANELDIVPEEFRLRTEDLAVELPSLGLPNLAFPN